MSISSENLVQSLAQLQSYVNRGASEPDRNTMNVTIAISRQAGSRGAEIARAVGMRLNWPVYDHELLSRIAQEMGLHERLLERLDERHKDWLEEILHSLVGDDRSSSAKYIKHLIEQLISLGEVGHCVIVGRGAAQVLAPTSTLRVRVVASRAFRVGAIAREKNLCTVEAERWVDRTDKERLEFVRKAFQKDATDPTGYDLILNSERLGIETCAKLIVDAALAVEQAFRGKKQPVPIR